MALKVAHGFTALFDSGEEVGRESNPAESLLREPGKEGRDAASVSVFNQQVLELLPSPQGCPGFQDEKPLPVESCRSTQHLPGSRGVTLLASAGSWSQTVPSYTKHCSKASRSTASRTHPCCRN